MTFAAFIATVIIVLFLITIIMAVGSYGAYKLRERRRPDRAGGSTPVAAPWFERVEASELEGRRS